MTIEYFGFDFEAHVRRMAPAGASLAAVRIDSDGRIVEATSDAAALLGYTPQELTGRTLADLAAPGWRAAAEDATSRILRGALVSRDLLLCGRSGRRTLLRMSARPTDGRAGGEHLVGWTQVPGDPELATVPDGAGEELRGIGYELLSTQEAERTRVAGELHGAVAPLVIMAKFMVEDALQRLLRGAHSEAADVLLQVTGRLRDVIDEVRRISTQLRPSLLDDLGLLPTIEWFCRRCEQAYRTLRIERAIDVAETDVPGALKLDIFRIIEEALTNVAQHAHARCVRITLARHGDELQLTISDDGCGFDAAQLQHGNAGLLGAGLQRIKERVDGTHGRLLLESTPLAGTVIGAAWTLQRQRGAAA
jgi:two-component system NarL family sensor kinase